MNSTEGWTEEDHFNFYESLKGLSHEERSRALIAKATQILKTAGNENQDLIKAAESIMTFWTINNRVDADQDAANSLMYQIYMRMGEPERAKAFR